MNKTNPALFERYLLIKFSNQYADEFDVEGFTVMSEKDWDAHVAMATKRFGKLPPDHDRSEKDLDAFFYENRRQKEIDVSFGTNEAVTYSSLEDYMCSFHITELNAEQYQTLQELFGEHTDGYSYEYDGKTISIPPRDTIQNGMVCMLDDNEDEDES